MVLIQESHFHLYFEGSLHHSAVGAPFTNLTPLFTISYFLLQDELSDFYTLYCMIRVLYGFRNGQFDKCKTKPYGFAMFHK